MGMVAKRQIYTERHSPERFQKIMVAERGFFRQGGRTDCEELREKAVRREMISAKRLFEKSVGEKKWYNSATSFFSVYQFLKLLISY